MSCSPPRPQSSKLKRKRGACFTKSDVYVTRRSTPSVHLVHIELWGKGGWDSWRTVLDRVFILQTPVWQRPPWVRFKVCCSTLICHCGFVDLSYLTYEMLSILRNLVDPTTTGQPWYGMRRRVIICQCNFTQLNSTLRGHAARTALFFVWPRCIWAILIRKSFHTEAK